MSVNQILVVDDSQTIRVQLQRILADAGYDVITACDGEDAIQRVIANRPALLVLDINMPGIDGFGVCEYLKQMNPEFSRVPIVFLTCVKSKALQLLGSEFGAYLQKPVCSQKLLEVVEKHFSQPCT